MRDVEFSPEDATRTELDFLADAGIVNEATLEYLRGYRFGGDIWGYAEGDCYFPGSPILVVQASFAEAVLLETISLSILNHDCAIASAASRMVTAAAGRPQLKYSMRTRLVAPSHRFGKRPQSVCAICSASSRCGNIGSTVNCSGERPLGTGRVSISEISRVSAKAPGTSLE